MRSLVDGQRAAGLPADDRGLLFGETVFETVAFRDRCAPLWDPHMERLARSAAWLGLEAPSADAWRQDCQRLLPRHGRHVLRLTLSAGSGGSGYWPAESPSPRRVVCLREWPLRVETQRASGLRLRRSSYPMPVDAPGQGHKHGNRLLQVRAARECADSGHDEAVLLDPQGHMVETISSNLLLLRGDRLLVHPAPAVAGVGLNWLRRLEPALVQEEAVPYDALGECSEVLVINSVAGIRPVVAIEQFRFSIGPICRRLQSLWDSQLI